MSENLEYAQEKQADLLDQTRQVALRVLAGERGADILDEVERLQFEHDGLVQVLQFMLAQSPEQDRGLMDDIDAVLASEGEAQ